jgi:O-acetyl-ADP-ribose deacetylase (regulator of RNase III)
LQAPLPILHHIPDLETMAASAPSTVDLPHIHLLCLYKSFSAAFDAAAEKYFPDISSQVQVTKHFGPLNKVADDLRFDAIVSPANSYARLDGAFDDAISRALSPKNDYHWTTKRAQKVLYEKWKGFAPPGTCTVIPLLDETPNNEGAGSSSSGPTEFKWGTQYILLCPTMRIPQPVNWDREVVYECIWAMLCAIDQHNKTAKDGSQKIRSILMTPLATGVGMVAYERWAEQCVLAIRDWIDAERHPEKWSNLSWGGIFRQVRDVRQTWQGKNTTKDEDLDEMEEFMGDGK